jgi:hypothetical protein
MNPSTLRPLGSSVYRLSSVNDNSETSVAKVSNMIDHSRPPSFRVGKMVDFRALDLWFHLRVSVDALLIWL